MNIFFLHLDPEQNAIQNNDYHIRSTIRELLAMMGGAYEQDKYIQKNAHFGGIYSHPMGKWVRQSEANFKWCIDYLECMFKEFKHRQKDHKEHASQPKLDWIINQPLPIFVRKEWIDPPRCFGALKGIIKETESIEKDYQNYYKIGKRHLAKWSRREIPAWYQ